MAIGDSAGTALSFAGFTYKITSLSGPGISNDEIDTTHLSTTTDKTYIPSTIAEPGELTLSGQFDPTLTPGLGTTGTATVTWVTGKTWAADAFLKAFEPGAPGFGELLNFDATFKLSGDVTIVST